MRILLLDSAGAYTVAEPVEAMLDDGLGASDASTLSIHIRNASPHTRSWVSRNVKAVCILMDAAIPQVTLPTGHRGGWFFGPYDLVEVSKTGEGTLNPLLLTCRKNDFWKERLTAQGVGVERGIINDLGSQLALFAQSQPYRTWYADPYPGVDYIQNLMTANIMAARSFADVVQACEEFSFTAFADVLPALASDRITASVQVVGVPKYPVFEDTDLVAGGHPRVNDLQYRSHYWWHNPNLDAFTLAGIGSRNARPEEMLIAIPSQQGDARITYRDDPTNGPGDFRTQEIVASVRSFGLQADLITSRTPAQGGSGPTVYLDTQAGGKTLDKLASEAVRWTFQNQCSPMTINWPQPWNSHAFQSPPRPGMLLDISAIVSSDDALLLGARAKALIHRVSYQWSRLGLTLQFQATLWQGAPELIEPLSRIAVTGIIPIIGEQGVLGTFNPPTITGGVPRTETPAYIVTVQWPDALTSPRADYFALDASNRIRIDPRFGYVGAAVGTVTDAREDSAEFTIPIDILGQTKASIQTEGLEDLTKADQTPIPIMLAIGDEYKPAIEYVGGTPPYTLTTLAKPASSTVDTTGTVPEWASIEAADLVGRDVTVDDVTTSYGDYEFRVTDSSSPLRSFQYKIVLTETPSDG